MTSEQLNAWLAGLDIPSKEGLLYLVEINNSNEDPGSITAYEADGDWPRYLSIFINETGIEGGTRLSYLYYLPEATTYEGTTIPAGWSYIVVDVLEGEEVEQTITVTPVTEKQTYTFLRTYNVTDVAEEFDALNGVVLGMVEGEPAVYHDLTVNVTNGSSDAPEQIEGDLPTDFSITPATGYTYPSTIEVIGTEDYEYDENKGDVTITADADVTVNATCPALMRSITATVTNGSASGATEIQDSIGTATVTIEPGSGYNLPSSVSVSGASYTYDDTTGVISLSNADSDVSITANCPPEGLLSFTQGASFSGVVVDPEGVSANDLATWLSSLSTGDVLAWSVNSNAATPWAVTTIDGKKALKIPLSYYGSIKSTPAEIVCVADDASYTYTDSNGTTTLSLTKGWNVITSGNGADDTASAAAISSLSTYSLQDGTGEVTTVSADLSTINGVAVGRA